MKTPDEIRQQDKFERMQALADQFNGEECNDFLAFNIWKRCLGMPVDEFYLLLTILLMRKKG